MIAWCWHIWLECQAFSNNCFSQQIPAFMHASKLIFWWAVKLVKLTMQTVASWDLGRNSAGYQGPICSSSTHSVRTNCYETNLAGCWLQWKWHHVMWAGQARPVSVTTAAWLPLSQDHPAEHFNLAQFVSCHQTPATSHQATPLATLLHLIPRQQLWKSFRDYSPPPPPPPPPIYIFIDREGCLGTIKHSQSDLCSVRAHSSPS